MSGDLVRAIADIWPTHCGIALFPLFSLRRPTRNWVGRWVMPRAFTHVRMPRSLCVEGDHPSVRTPCRRSGGRDIIAARASPRHILHPPIRCKNRERGRSTPGAYRRECVWRRWFWRSGCHPGPPAPRRSCSREPSCRIHNSSFPFAWTDLIALRLRVAQ